MYRLSCINASCPTHGRSRPSCPDHGQARSDAPDNPVDNPPAQPPLSTACAEPKRSIHHPLNPATGGLWISCATDVPSEPGVARVLAGWTTAAVADDSDLPYRDKAARIILMRASATLRRLL